MKKTILIYLISFFTINFSIAENIIFFDQIILKAL